MLQTILGIYKTNCLVRNSGPFLVFFNFLGIKVVLLSLITAVLPGYRKWFLQECKQASGDGLRTAG